MLVLFLPPSYIQDAAPEKPSFRSAQELRLDWLTAIGNGIYYGFSIVWPQAVANIYRYQGDGLSYSRFSTLSGLTPMCFVLGQIFGTVVCTYTGPNPGIIATITISAPILCAAAADPLNLSLTMGLIATGCFFTGMMVRTPPLSSEDLPLTK
ncbi:hypothetical protein P280DRAFT_519279 [Massarina eburnea CBS 473.64]|uniref:MFS general substrate transporter n=1 Tax=Massarina eburnea CBS 473.64 TaxID=1395130 RepID=A0A6A6RWH5_9PLEO|nr:hypothetical protein P280DRAFT_519279 [Massarina eburnea CBS 473.64]